MAYADPLIFAAAVAMKTQRVRIGFAVVELALHHPVRLAVEKALDQTWAQRGLYVSESDKEAIEMAAIPGGRQNPVNPDIPIGFS